jgi:hypothetical protein
MVSFAELDIDHVVAPPRGRPVVEYAKIVHVTVSPGAADDDDSEMLDDPYVYVELPSPPLPPPLLPLVMVTVLVLVYLCEPTSYWKKKITVPALYAFHW